MSRARIAIFGFGLCLLAAPGVALAAPRHLERPWYLELHKRPLSGAPFSAAEEKTIRDYFAAHPQEVDAIDARDAQALAHAKPLPRHAPRRAIPPALADALPPRAGQQVLIVGRDVVLYEQNRQLVIDVLRDVL